MKSHLVLVATLALPLLAAGPAAASPISYAFTGTLDTPLNSSREFSGTFTFDSDPTVAPVSFSQWAKVGVNADITLNVGGQTIEFSSSQDPNGLNAHRIEAGVSPGSAMNPKNTSYDEVLIFGSNRNTASPPWANFSIASYALSSTQDLSDLSTLKFIPNFSTIGLNYTFSDGEIYNGFGSINTLAPIATPEPSTWLIALLAGGAAALRLRRSA